ncbi:MAG: MFS transporter [Balneolales bacterium]|nr:MFS transporter [Balneolales bacterium]
MGVSSITPVLPLVATVFEISIGRAALLITMYTLPGVLLTPVLGILSDRIGRKMVLVPSMLLFGVAGFACAFAPNYEMLLFLRLLQGVGSAAIGALNVTMIGDIFSGQQRTEAMGYNGAVLSVGATLYPAIGGALAVLGWFAPFYLPLLALPTAFVIIFYLENPEPEQTGKVGAYLKRVLINMKQNRMLPFFLATLVSFVLLYGPLLTIIPFLIESRFTEASFMIGLVLSSASVSNALASVNAGLLTQRFRPEALVTFSFVIYAVSLTAMPFAPNLIWLTAATVIYGFAQGLNLPVLISLISSEAMLENRGAIMSLNGMVIKIAQSVSPILSSILFGIAGFAGLYALCALLALITGLYLLIRLR